MRAGRVSAGGHKGGLQLGELLRLIERSAYRIRHVAFNRVGVRIGLPPDVATIMLGPPDKGLWWNLRVGIVPEHSVRQVGGVVDDEEVLELMHKYGMDPLSRKMMTASLSGRSDAMPLLTERHFKRRLPSKLLYIGWREALKSMLENRAIRGSAEAEQLLGIRDYAAVMRKRRLRDTVHFDE